MAMMDYLMHGIDNQDEQIVIEGEFAVVASEAGRDPHQPGVHQTEH